jgi:aryl-alcohol dehydrogenase-like predicted oxidoreductase
VVNPNNIVLGTSNWGIKVSKEEARAILVQYYSHGFRWIDTATNYPIDGVPEHFGLTLSWLRQFLKEFPGIRIYVKAGSATNLNTPEQLISRDYFELCYQRLRADFGESFSGLAIHWDQGEDDGKVTELLAFLANSARDGLRVGLSGIIKLTQYSAKTVEYEIPWTYQLNASPFTENLESRVAFIRSHFPKSTVIGYNLLAGLAGKGITSPLNRIQEISTILNLKPNASKTQLIQAVLTRGLKAGLDGFVIGPTKAEQCQDWITAIESLGNEEN